jgi:hypothetical protein
MALGQAAATNRPTAMRDSYIREKFTRERSAARKLAQEYISKDFQKTGTRPRSRAGVTSNRRIMSSR